MIDSSTISLSGFIRPYLPDSVAAHLRTCISTGGLQGHLPGERQLADELKVSRPTIRVALSMLVSEGLITRRHGSVTRVVATPFGAGESHAGRPASRTAPAVFPSAIKQAVPETCLVG